MEILATCDPKGALGVLDCARFGTDLALTDPFQTQCKQHSPQPNICQKGSTLVFPILPDDPTVCFSDSCVIHAQIGELPTSRDLEIHM
jgi:hypothetical protein